MTTTTEESPRHLPEPDDRAVLEQAGASFTDLVHAVPSSAWRAATPCTEWDVRALVNHLVSEHRWVPDLLGGATVAEVGSRYDGDLLGDDPVEAWDLAWAESSAAWAGVAEDATVELSSGTTPITTYREQMIVDLVVHGWDLSRGAGLPPAGTPQAIRRALEIGRREAAAYAGSGLFADPVEIDTDDPLLELVALLGRRP